MAAAVFVPPSPYDPLVRMAATSRRAPLGNITNAVNSPHALLTNSGSKRPRSFVNASQHENEPPTKRQAVEKTTTRPEPVTPRRQQQSAEGMVFERGTREGASNAFQRKLVAARDRRGDLKVTKKIEQPVEDIGNIQQWRKHYRKLFPSFSFYFDNVPDDLRARFVKQIVFLGGREESFFSKSVTHIITTRAVPDEQKSPADDETNLNDEPPQTINPLLLERHNLSNARPLSQAITAVKRETNNMDILKRGRDMGMKIWVTEKLHRVLVTIFGDNISQGRTTRGRDSIVHATKPVQEDLSQVLKNERVGATYERNHLSVFNDMVIFKGPFIYIHDLDEKMKPAMLREYPKPARRQDGEWPQFRSAGAGKCPFVEDPQMRRDIEQERERERQQALFAQRAEQESRSGTRLQQVMHQPRKIEAIAQPPVQPRATVKLEAPGMQPPHRRSPRKALQTLVNVPGNMPSVTCATTKPQVPVLDRQSSFPPMPENQNFQYIRPSAIQLGREPAASGLQRSNMTSAIQSQMISSTAATGVKANTSREVHELKRKVLERSHTGSLSVGSVPSSHRMQDLAGAFQNARAPAPKRAAKSRAQEKLGGIQEEKDHYVDKTGAEKTAQPAQNRRRAAAKKDPKPGYCENCRDKYEDFEEHILSRKHRKFAMTASNWTELDALLAKLQP